MQQGNDGSIGVTDGSKVETAAQREGTETGRAA
jgi:hypothetical protein